jgi:hypothetical protein
MPFRPILQVVRAALASLGTVMTLIGHSEGQDDLL